MSYQTCNVCIYIYTHIIYIYISPSMYKNLRYGSYTKWPQTEIHLLWPIWLWRMVTLPLASKRSWPTFPRMSRSWSKSVTWKWGGKHHQDLKINGCFNVESDAKPQIWGFACFSDNPIFSWWLPHSENRLSTRSEVSCIGDSEHQFFGKFCGVSTRFHGGFMVDFHWIGISGRFGCHWTERMNDKNGTGSPPNIHIFESFYGWFRRIIKFGVVVCCCAIRSWMNHLPQMYLLESTGTSM